ncbi:MAG: MATE family efflux transporter [Akkermansiaceae bacterium]
MSRSLSFTTDPISRLTWQIALPMSIGMFFNTMFNVVDTYYAGWLGTEALAALSLSFPLYFGLFAVGSGIGQGTTALLANALGEKKPESARKIFAQAVFFLIVSSLIVSCISLFTAPWLFRQLGAEESYLETALAYINLIFIGGVFVLLPMVLNSALSAEGRTRYYRNVLIVGFFANLLLNPLFIIGWLGLPKMGVSGIALATVLVQIGACVYLWFKVAQTPIYAKLTLREFRPNLAILKKIAGQAAPAALNMLTIAIGIFVMTWYVKHFGKEAVAATGIATRIEQIVLLPTIGLNVAVMSIIGQNYGAGLQHRVREAWLTNIRYGFFLMLGGGVIIILLRKPAMQLFTEDSRVVNHGVDYLLSSSLTLAAYPILFVTVFALQGIKRPFYGLWMGLYRQLVAPALVFYLLAFVFAWGTWGIWWGTCMIVWSSALFSLFWGWRVLGRDVKSL